MFYIPHDPVMLDCGDVEMTKQSHKDECDIHNILKQFQRTGIITHVQSARPEYTDLPSDFDYQSSLNTIIAAEQAFSNLPAVVRDHFRNDPTAFLAAFDDPRQADKLREFGLLKPAQAADEPAATPLPATPPEPSGGPS